MGIYALESYVLILRGQNLLGFINGLSTNKVEGTCTTIFVDKVAKIVDMVDVIEMDGFIALVGHLNYKERLIQAITSKILGQQISIGDATNSNDVFLSTEDIDVGDDSTKVETFRGWLIVSPAGKGPIADMTEEEFADYRVKNMIPHQEFEISEKVHPLTCGLGHLVHENKGCYIGQEVLVRMRSRGRYGKELVCELNPVENPTTIGKSHSLTIKRISRGEFNE